MGFELGPGMLRRAPRGWLPARAFALKRSIYSHGHGDGSGVAELETSMGMSVRWRVEIPGREPYELEEERSVPNWLSSGPLASHGNRWYKVRVRPQYGLMPRLGVPCVVDPADPAGIWIDWDAAYKEHVPAWEQEARVQREIARRDGRFDHVVDRITNPFAGKLRPGEKELVEQRIANARSRAPAARAAGEGGESAEHKRRMDDLVRIQKTGRKTRGTVVACAATSQSLATIPLVMITFEVEGRHLVFEHVYGPRHLSHYKPGREVDIWIDPDDPGNVCPGR
jgi:hypothetical protein